MAHPRSSLALGLVLVVLASPASAERVKQKTAREKAAQKACSLGDYQKGVDILADLLVGSDDPNYIYNQARCYEQNSRWEQAINRFREYLRKDASLSDSDRADAERHIDECEKALAQAAYNKNTHVGSCQATCTNDDQYGTIACDGQSDGSESLQCCSTRYNGVWQSTTCGLCQSPVSELLVLPTCNTNADCTLSSCQIEPPTTTILVCQ